MGVTIATPSVLHLSLIVGRDLRDADGLRLGKLDDLIVRLGSDDYPPIIGALATIAGRAVFVPADVITSIEPAATTIRKSRLDLQPFARRAHEVLLKEDVLDRQLINVDGARLVRTNEIEVARIDGWYRVVGVDTGPRGLFRRLVPRRFADTIRSGTFLDWASVEPFTGHVPSLRLRIPHPKLARLHPAELADLVEAASHREGEEILKAVRHDAEREADVFEELDTLHQIEFMDKMSDELAAGVLSRMESDDAADLINDLDEGRREQVIALLTPVQRRRVRALLGYDATTAGGLMSPDFICVYMQATSAEALERVRRSSGSPDSVTWIYVMNEHRRLNGAIQVIELLRADAGAAIGDIAGAAKHVRPDAELEEVARLMTDFDLTVVPVTDAEQRIIGVITVDDVLEIVLPPGWRRNFRMLGDD